MSKKSFKDNPAMAFISQKKHDSVLQPELQEIALYDHLKNNTQQDTYIDTQYIAQQNAPVDTQHIPQQNASVDTQYNTLLPRSGYIRTQGRKGHKKPRINLAFDSDELLGEIRKQAEKEGKSITQLMNEAIMIYLDNVK